MYSQVIHFTDMEVLGKKPLTSVDRFELGAEIQLKAHGTEDRNLLQKLIGVYQTVTRRPRTYIGGEEICGAPSGWYWTTFEGNGLQSM